MVEASKKLAIFDLGQVCQRTEYELSYETWERLAGVEPGSMLRGSLEFEEHFMYERGEMGCHEFASWFCDHFSLKLSFGEWSEGWNALFTELIEPTVDTVMQMKEAGMRLVILSNTNQDHFAKWGREHAPFVDLFDRVYLSHQLGMRKPDAKIFEHVLAQEGVAASEAVFFDDRLENVMSAGELGIESVHFSGDASARNWWVANGLG